MGQTLREHGPHDRVRHVHLFCDHHHGRVHLYVRHHDHLLFWHDHHGHLLCGHGRHDLQIHFISNSSIFSAFFAIEPNGFTKKFSMSSPTQNTISASCNIFAWDGFNENP